MTKIHTSKRSVKGLAHWLETKFCIPEFAGGMLIAIAGFYFMAATNTLAGWLYVISGVSFALLLIGAIVPARLLKDINVERSPLEPISAGDILVVELIFHNRSSKGGKALLQVYDLVPPKLSSAVSVETVIEQLLPGQSFRWTYSIPTQRRGIYQFQALQLATASPFGLFRSQRTHASNSSKQTAIIYPTVLTLAHCPLIDRIGRDNSPKQYSLEHTYNSGTEGITRTLRPYRWGDPIRLVHWRTSARFGELRVRELEVTVGGEELVIALDIKPGWGEIEFEQAVVAAASLYFYAQRLNLNVKLWTLSEGLQHGNRAVLETLARVTAGEFADNAPTELPDVPLVWLTHRSDSLTGLPLGSRWLLWQSLAVPKSVERVAGLIVDIETTADAETMYRALTNQLQAQPELY